MVDIRVTNNGDSAIPGRWKLKFSFNEDRVIVRNPNGYVVSPMKGRDMTVTEDKGVGINPHSTVHFGIYTYGRDTSTFAPPNTFTLNGATCVDNII
ncbi:cellulose binding domain-containing protein [Streptomyces sp. NPDC050658]|uniref:cellulose binding domain-containing protein n=1 Tax=Streptomyces sp. NPDC050658 TaxID=3365633 RepID=UPI003790E334